MDRITSNPVRDSLPLSSWIRVCSEMILREVKKHANEASDGIALRSE